MGVGVGVWVGGLELCCGGGATLLLEMVARGETYLTSPGYFK